MAKSKLKQLQNLIDKMNADQIIEIFDIDVWSMANDDITQFDEMQLDAFIDDCKNIIKEN